MPKKLLVVAADPGSEHKDTVRIRDKTMSDLREMGIHAVVAPGPKMHTDLLERKANGSTRIDSAAYWTEGGGRLMQKCTRHYKIEPMDRVVNAYLKYHMGMKSFPENCVERWIGFAWDEIARCSPMRQSYQQARYPLIDMRETKEDVINWYKKTGEEMPPPSVCNHCWANGTRTFKRIHDTDKDGWNAAKRFDEDSRDLSQFGVNEKCFCSQTRMSLQELEDNGFEVKSGDASVLSCDSGMCFI